MNISSLLTEAKRSAQPPLFPGESKRCYPAIEAAPRSHLPVLFFLSSSRDTSLDLIEMNSLLGVCQSCFLTSWSRKSGSAVTSLTVCRKEMKIFERSLWSLAPGGEPWSLLKPKQWQGKNVERTQGLGSGRGCPERLWSLLPWRYPKALWTQCWIMCSTGLCSSRKVGPDDLQWFLPASLILWFYDTQHCWQIFWLPCFIQFGFHFLFFTHFLQCCKRKLTWVKTHLALKFLLSMASDS